MLVEHFLRRLNARYAQRVAISPAAMQRLCGYRWPGNVRELQHVVEYATIMTDTQTIEVAHLPEELQAAEGQAAEPLISLRQLEQAHIARVLRLLRGNRQQTAQVLGISERTLYRKLKEYDLDLDG